MCVSVGSENILERDGEMVFIVSMSYRHSLRTREKLCVRRWMQERESGNTHISSFLWMIFCNHFNQWFLLQCLEVVWDNHANVIRHILECIDNPHISQADKMAPSVILVDSFIDTIRYSVNIMTPCNRIAGNYIVKEDEASWPHSPVRLPTEPHPNLMGSAGFEPTSRQTIRKRKLKASLVE